MRVDSLRRVFDIVVASIVLIVTLPILLVAIAGSAVTLRAWPFFTQHRIGRHGRPFRLVKLRTLPVGTPRYVDKDRIRAVVIPRFTWTLRLLHIDELPQLLLVITGRMSLVGPRPEMPFLYERLDPHFASARSELRPGCTGLWQVGAHCHRLIGEHPEYDEYYLQKRSTRLDLWIILRTFRKMIPVSNRLVDLDRIPAWVVSQPRAHDAELLPIALELRQLEPQTVDA